MKIKSLFKQKKTPIDDVITTDSIVDSIEKRRKRIDDAQIESPMGQDKAVEMLALFPLNYPVDEMEISLSCGIGWTLTLTIINRLVKEGSWEFVDIASRLGKGRRIQRVR